jgi:hypothetical protein
MHQKTLRYLLAGGAIFVWGTVMIKIFSSLEQDQAGPGYTAPVTTPAVFNQVDTFSLLNNYSDPFLPEAAEGDTLMEINTGKTVLPTAVITSPPLPEKIDISFIKYLGMIANPDKKLRAAIVSVKGKETIIKEGSQIEEVTIKKVTADKIDILYKGKKYSISKAL